MDENILIPTSYEYAQIDEQGYCFGKSTLSGEIDYPNMILLSEEDNVQLGQKYERENKVWLDEFKPEEPQPIPLTLGDVNENIISTKTIATTTEETVLMTSEDALLLMEMLVQVDEKINTLLMSK